MKFSAVIVTLAFGSAAAFAPQQGSAPMRTTELSAKRGGRNAKKASLSAKDELMALAEANPDKLGNSIGFWDPLSLADQEFWGLSNEATIGYLRHAEIKHGRVAMAAFLGFCAQCTDAVKGPHPILHGRVAMAAFLGFCAQCTDAVKGPHPILPYKGFVENVSPQEQWDNIPGFGKFQILVLIGMLESYGEGAGMDESEYVHYTKGGKPGFYPSIKGKAFGQIPVDLFDPFGILPGMTDEEKVRGLKAEVNNGRAAMLAIFALLSASKGLVVPPLNSIPDFPLYDGNVMVPFSNDFSWISGTARRVAESSGPAIDLRALDM
eukprot:CAMPEP_0182600156 /NCGR_PEP_ID=MMETSP1324-20130603/90837_1 /TAXON_ID=236786 /ORGANISM="Florenciella sp., Strain RCC1587" /LENGTH=320 /DNA_ID=CAMNT_0024818067 /DNA_START=14 /DNA_END=977 /DNA_ORIENTATION=+